MPIAISPVCLAINYIALVHYMPFSQTHRDPNTDVFFLWRRSMADDVTSTDSSRPCCDSKRHMSWRHDRPLVSHSVRKQGYSDSGDTGGIVLNYSFRYVQEFDPQFGDRMHRCSILQLPHSGVLIPAGARSVIGHVSIDILVLPVPCCREMDQQTRLQLKPSAWLNDLVPDSTPSVEPYSSVLLLLDTVFYHHYHRAAAAADAAVQ